MAPSLFEKAKFRTRRFFQAAPQEPASAPSPPTPPTPSRPVSQPTTQPTSQSTPSPPTSTDSDTSLPSLQERLWNEAYDGLKASEPKLVGAYEKILSAKLHGNDPSSVASEPTNNEIASARGTRCRQMQQLVQAGLDRTQKQASIKRGIDEGLQAVQEVRRIVDKAVYAAPEAAVAWVGVCLGLEILSNPVTEARDNRKGIAYVLSRIEWYWNLVSLLLDENKAEQSSAGLRVQLEKHIMQLYEKLLAYQIKSVCLYHRNWATVIGRDLLKIDDWAGQLSEIQEAEAAVRRDMEQYNTEESKKQFRKLTDTVSAIEMNLQDIHSAIEDQTRQQEKRYQDNKYDKCMQDLHVTDPRKDKKRIQDTKGGLLRDSYRWILDHADFQRFRDDPQSRLLWIKGDPSKGKTMLLCGIIDELEKGPNSLLSYFFFLIVDALDECTTDRPQLLDFIIQSSSTSSSRVKWVVSSRNWQDIEEKLDNTKQKVRLHLELNKNSISKAVDTYIGYKVNRLAGLKNYDKETRDAIKNHLTSNADGTFLWVALVCQELADTKVVRKRHTLSKLNLFPSGLDPLYKRMMEQISDSSDAEICKEILAIASVVYRPITLEELKVLVESLEEDDYNDLPQIIKACGSFLTLREGVIYFVHQSAKDFLLNKASDQILPSGTAHQHHTFFSRSLAALSETLRRDVYSLSTPGYSIDQVSPPNPDPLSSIRYSCAVHKLEALVRTTGSQQLAELLRDARRFILSHKRPIEIAPLQSYASALVFSPEYSLIRELFKKKEPDWMILKPRMEAEWNACLQTLEGHGDSVRSVAFSADGRRLASGSVDETVKVWDAATGACVQTLEGHGSWVFSVAFSADSRRLASGSDDETVKVWDAATGACVQTLEGHGDSVRSVAFSADSRHLASGSDDETVKVWDAATGACVQTLEGHGSSVISVAFSADGRRLASGSGDETVKVWDAATGACVQTLEGHGSWVFSVAFSADSRRLASGSGDKTVKVWDAATGACVQTLEVGRVITYLSFYLTSSSHLSTDIGLLSLDIPALPSTIESQPTDAVSRGISHTGYGVSTDGVWIMKDEKTMLWLPPEYRAEKSAVVGSTVAIGSRSGRVLVMKFSSSGCR
ncbi:Hypothetical protein NCS54_01107600 [Fusarium falciforme]|uniref:Hypothetical protein n=1 Tax=Fusarium falciforme TaxID=195108 RepID=UPI002300B6B7|nr:Hypothetical protein NCS54_01107600 [Fusarium falciforme]WAO93526.1 Hypothetical protein NCS54_01107600 [Fusarium falciforme]